MPHHHTLYHYACPILIRFCFAILQFFRDGDIIIAETGTSSFGIINIPFPSRATLISQVLWGSIGYATGSCLGAALAAKEVKEPNRTILFTGDGSLQLTCQEVRFLALNSLHYFPFLEDINADVSMHLYFLGRYHAPT